MKSPVKQRNHIISFYKMLFLKIIHQSGAQLLSTYLIAQLILTSLRNLMGLFPSVFAVGTNFCKVCLSVVPIYCLFRL